MANTTPLRLAALGMTQRDQNMLELFLRTLPNTPFTLVTDGLADASIVDLDLFGSQQLFEQHRQQYPDRPLIVLSVTPRDSDSALFVAKPICPGKLTAALNKIRMRLAPAAANRARTKPVAQPPVKPAAPAAPEPFGYANQFRHATPEQTPGAGASHEAFQPTWNVGPKAQTAARDLATYRPVTYRPALFLQGHIEEAVRLAREKNCVVRLLGAAWRPITISPQPLSIAVEGHEGHLRAVSLLPQRRRQPRWRKDVTIMLLDTPRNADDNGADGYHSVEAFLWKLALWTSRGRLPEGTDPTRPVRLRRWPNHTRLPPLPHALRISALLINRPCSLLQAARALDIEPGYVFVYYSAALAAGLIDNIDNANTAADNTGTATHDDQRTLPAPAVQLQRGLLARILHKLRQPARLTEVE